MLNKTNKQGKQTKNKKMKTEKPWHNNMKHGTWKDAIDLIFGWSSTAGHTVAQP